MAMIFTSYTAMWFSQSLAFGGHNHFGKILRGLHQLMSPSTRDSTSGTVLGRLPPVDADGGKSDHMLESDRPRMQPPFLNHFRLLM